MAIRFEHGRSRQVQFLLDSLYRGSVLENASIGEERECLIPYVKRNTTAWINFILDFAINFPDFLVLLPDFQVTSRKG